MNVRSIQQRLKAIGFPVKIDGVIGPETERAVRAFQARVGLVEDGDPGPQTQTALIRFQAPASTPKRPEPDKSAISGPVPESAPSRDDLAFPPPNAATLELLDTKRPISEIIVHCTATPEGKDYTVADIRAWHKARKWSDIGYHYVVYRDGRVMLGRPVGQIGAHVENRNSGTIGISYVGGLTRDGKQAKDTRTPQQRSSLLWLVGELARKHKGVRRISGHNQYANKACPSFRVPDDALGSIETN